MLANIHFKTLLSSHRLCKNVKIKAYKVTTFSVPSCGSELCFLTLGGGGGRGLIYRSFESKRLRRKSELDRKQTGGWNTLRAPCFVLRAKYHWDVRSRSVRWTRHVARTGKKRKAYRFLVGIVNVKMSVYTPWRHTGDWGIAPLILNLGTISKRVVRFTLRPL
jgi:hypothetical protein